MTEIQELQLNLLIKLDAVCRKHHMVYYLAYGTCIGAIRHKGFIPWDHDIDVLMPIEDVNKLVQLQGEFGERYFISSYKTDENNKTVKMSLFDLNNKCQITSKNGIEITNVGMDIYPLYSCPPSKLGVLFNVWRSHFYKLLVGGTPKNHGKVARFVGNSILLFFPERKMKNVLTIIEHKLNYTGESNEVADYYGKDISLCSAITYKKEWFSEPALLEFEGRYFYGPTNPDEYLTKRYGDYMTPLSPEERQEEDKIELIS